MTEREKKEGNEKEENKRGNGRARKTAEDL